MTEKEAAEKGYVTVWYLMAGESDEWVLNGFEKTVADALVWIANMVDPSKSAPTDARLNGYRVTNGAGEVLVMVAPAGYRIDGADVALGDELQSLFAETESEVQHD